MNTNLGYKKKNLIGVLALVAIIVIIQLISLDRFNDDFGNSYDRVVNHYEFYRVFTCIFLHSGFDHLLSNAFSLFIIGLAITRKQSLTSFYLCFIITGIAASLGSLIYYGIIMQETDIISVGASGGIFGVLGALVLFSLLMEKGRDKLGAFIYALLVFFIGMENLKTDNAAHFTGLVAGIIFELVFLLIRKHKQTI